MTGRSISAERMNRERTRLLAGASLAFAALLAAGCSNEPDTLVTDPATVNEAADSAAETGRPTITPIELGNGAANAADQNGAVSNAQ